MSRQNDEEFDELESRESGTRKTRRRSRPDSRNEPIRRRRRWPYVLLLLLAVVFFLPNMIGWFGLQQKAIDFAMSDFKGDLSVEKVSLGWLQPIKLTNVSANDVNGNSLFTVDSVTSSKPLYSFATSSDYGQFDVVKPVAYVQLRPDGSNLEDAFSNYIAQPNPDNPTPNPNAKPAAALPKINVNLTDGKLIVSTTTSTQMWKINELNAIAQVSSDTAPLIVDVQSTITPMVLDATGQTVLQTTGGMALTGQVDAGQKTLSFSAVDLLMETKDLPLSLAAPIMQRFVGPASTIGTMNGEIQAAYDAHSQSVAMDVKQLTLTGFGIVAPELIGSDQVMIDNVSANGIINASSKIISAQQFNLKSDVGSVKADGSFDVNQLGNLASGGTLLDTPFQMDGELDLAKLVRMLPSTLQLHQDLVVNSGVVTFQANSQNENGVRRMVVNLDTNNISAQRGAQNIDWAKPLRLVGTVRESQGQMALENVRCESDFLTIAGNADMQTGSFVAKGDLNKLMQRVSQFADLQGTNLAGVLDGKFGWQVDASAAQTNPLDGTTFPIQIGGSFVVDNPVIEMAGMPRWQQPQMSVKLSAAGKSNSTTLQLDQGGCQIDVGPERVVATLAQPIADAYTNEIWTAKCQMTGTMAGWLRHVQNFVDLGDVAADGQLLLNCDAALDMKTVQLENIQFQIEELGFNGYGMKIREPKATGTGIVVYDIATGDIAIPASTIAASSISARGKQLRITFPSNMQVAGNVEFRADVNRVAQWYELSPTQDSVFWYGTMDGTVQLASDENGIGGRLDSTVTDLIAAQQVAGQRAPNQTNQQGQIIQAAQATRQWQEIWREPKVGLAGVLSMSNDFNAISFQNAVIDSPSIKAKASGSIGDLAGSMMTDISGTWQPSWEKINSLLAAYTSGMLKFAGEGEQQFVMRGPIFDASIPPGQAQPWVSPRLQASANFGWQRGEILGLAVGESQIGVSLDQSIANLTTNGIPFAGGVVQVAPRLDLRGPSPMLTVDRNRIIDNVALQPETARQWLKYVAPLAADATSAQGNFTVDVGAARVPLLDPMKMEVQATVQLSNVVIGAGPTAQQLIGTVKQLRTLLKPDSTDRDLNTWLQLSEQTIPVAVKDGRIFHENVTLSHKDLTIRTRGSVGFDQTLNMMAEIPIADDWIADKKYLASLRGKSISIPIGGTVSKPILDRSAIQSLSRDLVKQAASGVVQEKAAEYQQKLMGKVEAERNKLMGKFGEKLGQELGLPEGVGGGLQQLQGILPQGLGQPQGGQPVGGQGGTPTGQPTIQDQLKNRAQEEVFKGIGNLFGK